ETQTLIPLAGYEWICECVVNTVLRFDGRTGRSRNFKILERAYLVGVESLHGETLWLLDPQGATLTPMDASSGKTEPPLGMERPAATGGCRVRRRLGRRRASRRPPRPSDEGAYGARDAGRRLG